MGYWIIITRTQNLDILFWCMWLRTPHSTIGKTQGALAAHARDAQARAGRATPDVQQARLRSELEAQDESLA